MINDTPARQDWESGLCRALDIGMTLGAGISIVKSFCVFGYRVRRYEHERQR